MASNFAFTGEGERMQKPSGSGFGVDSYAEISTLERKEDALGIRRGRPGREGCVVLTHTYLLDAYIYVRTL